MMLDKTRERELRDVQDMALDHAIEEMNAAHQRGLDEKEDRGDRGFLTGMASKSVSVAVKIEQFIMLRNREMPGAFNDDPERERKAADSLIRNARAEVAEILEKVGAGPKPRARGGR
jgi:hypothetical protein